MGEFNVIGNYNEFGNNVTVGNFCEIGHSNYFGNDVIIQGRVRMADHCVIHHDVTLKYGVILTSGVIINEGSFLGPNVITIGSTAARKTIHGTKIGKRCFIGAGSQIAAGVSICDDVIIGAMSFVNKDITHTGTYVGVPVRKIK